MAIPLSVRELLDKPFELSQDQIDFYQANRYIKLRQVLDQETTEYVNQVISDQVADMNNVKTKVDERDTYGKAFLQLFNLWRENEEVKQFVFSKRLAKIAIRPCLKKVEEALRPGMPINTIGRWKLTKQ